MAYNMLFPFPGNFRNKICMMIKRSGRLTDCSVPILIDSVVEKND